MLYRSDRIPPGCPALAPTQILCLALALLLCSACTSYGPLMPTTETGVGEPVRFPVREGDRVRITLVDPGPLPLNTSDPAREPGQGGRDGGAVANSGLDVPRSVAVGANPAEGSFRQCCKEFEVLQISEEGLYGENAFVGWNQIDSIQVAEPDHLKTVGLVVTFPLWFPLAVVGAAVIAGPIALGVAEIALTPSAR